MGIAFKLCCFGAALSIRLPCIALALALVCLSHVWSSDSGGHARQCVCSSRDFLWCVRSVIARDFCEAGCGHAKYPEMLRGAYVTAVRVSVHEILDGKASGNIQREVCGWKLFFLLPRLLLFRPLRGGLVSKRKLHERMALFNAGDWAQLLLESNSIAEAGTQAAVRKRRQHVQDDISRRAARAERLALLGELSAGRQALEGATIAPGNLSTLRDLTDPIRRPAAPREPLHEDLTRFVPEHDFQLDPDVFLANVRSARRGAAAGPSGMTADHLRPLLESERDSEVLSELGASLARGEGPEVVWEAIRMGRMTALRKADGGVRGIVVGDIFRRSQSQWRPRHRHSNMHCRPRRGQSVSVTYCRPSLTWTRS